MRARPAPPAGPTVLAPHLERRAPNGARVALYAGELLATLPRLLPPASVDVVVTSPPYNLGVDYASYDDRRPRGEYLDWVEAVARALRGVLREDGSFFLNVAGPPSDPGRPWAIAARVEREFVLQNVIHWVKSIAIDRGAVGAGHGLERDLAVGHYKPVNSERYLHGAHEYIFQFTPHGDVPLDRLAVGVGYTDRSNVGRWKGAGRGVRCRGNTWFLPYATIRRRAHDRPHPATFPPELPERCLLLHGRAKVRLALDPFVGIGASAVAAYRLGLPFVGVDLDPGYLDEAGRRLDREALRTGPPRSGRS